MSEPPATQGHTARQPPPGAAVREYAAGIDPGAVAAWLLPFALIVYLALRGGGYDAVVSDEVGVAVWWVVLIGAIAGVIPAARSGLPGRIALGALVALAAWTALSFLGSLGWSESSERSATELARTATYLGAFAAAVLAVRPRHLRYALSGIAFGIAVVAALALGSRLHPAWFPDNDTAQLLPSTRYRLSYPLDYWNGVSYLVALGVPLVLGLATSARLIAVRALAAAALPMMALTMFFTFSRGGAVAVGAALVVYLALSGERLAKLPTVIVAAAGSGIVIAAATQRDALENGLLGSAARSQGDEMLAVLLVVCAGVALLQVAIALAGRHLEPAARLPRVSRGTAATAAGAIAVVAIAVFLAAGGASELSDRWDDFKAPPANASPTGASHFDSSSGNGRYQWWQSAYDAFKSEPVTGIGPGTFEFWWSREGSITGFVRDAHSLYLETLAELGLVGFALLATVLVTVLLTAVRRTLAAPIAARPQLAAATASCAAFCVAAGIDWVWELPVIPIAFLLLAGLLVGGATLVTRPGDLPAPEGGLGVRLGLVGLSILALVAIVPPLAGSTALENSQSDYRDGRLGDALEQARSAEKAQPYAASPEIQEALVLQAQKQLPAAAAAARAATRDEPTNWKTWYTLSSIEADAGATAAAHAHYEQARSLNPRSRLFTGG